MSCDRKGTGVTERKGSRSDAPVDAVDPGRRRRRGCALLIVLITAGCGTPAAERSITTSSSSQAVVPQATVPVTRLSWGVEVTREPIGPFVVVVEKPPFPQSHMPSAWVQLSFDTPDRGVNVSLTDDGSRLFTMAQSSECGSSVHPLQYGREDGRDLHADMVTALGILVEACGEKLDGGAGYQDLLRRAEPAFPAAFRLMRVRVVEQFGRGTERCRPREGNAVPDPNDPCG